MCRQIFNVLNSRGIIPRRSIRDCDSEAQQNFQTTGRFKLSAQVEKKLLKQIVSIKDAETPTSRNSDLRSRCNLKSSTLETLARGRQERPAGEPKAPNPATPVSHCGHAHPCPRLLAPKGRSFPSERHSKGVPHVGTALKTR